MKKFFLFIVFSSVLFAQQNPNFDWILSPFENLQSLTEGDSEFEAYYNSTQVIKENDPQNIEGLPIENDPPFHWVHPKPFGTSMGTVKVWDQNTVYAFGSAGTFVKTTDGGQTFQFNTYAGVQNPAPNILTNDIYGSYFFDMNNFYLCGVWGITRTTDGGQTFEQVGSSYFSSATLRGIYFLDGNNGFVVGTPAAKMSKTTDGGLTWTVDPNLPATTYYDVKAFSMQRILVAGATNSGGNIRLTTDGGTTWNVAAAGTGTIYKTAFFDSLTGFAGSTSGRGFKTTDGGLSWTQLTTISAPTTSTFYDVFIKGTELYFVEDDSLLYVSADSGLTFTKKRYLGIGQSTQVMRDADFSDSNIYVVGDNGYWFKSTDNGNTWSSPSQIVTSGFVRGIWGNSAGKLIVVGTNSPNQVMVSEDYGNTFTPVALSVSGADIRGFYMLNSSTGFAVGNTGRIWKTTNGGYDWGLTTVSTAAFSDVAFINDFFGVASGNNGQVFKTTDGGNNWINISPGSTIGFNGVSIIDTNTILVAGGVVVYKTTNGGTNWTQITTGIPPLSSPLSRIRMVSDSTGYIVGGSGTSGVGYVYKTADAGETWTNMNFPYTDNMLYHIAFRAPFDYVIVGAGGGVFHTTDDGISWTQYNFGLPMSGTSQVLGVSFIGTDTLIVGGIGATLVKARLNPIVPVELSSFSYSVNNNNVSLNWSTATELNNSGFEIQRKTSTSNNWTNIGFIPGKGTSSERNFYSFIDENLQPGSYNYRLRQIDFDGSVSVYNLTETVNVGVVDRFELSQNYPNPFNPSTVISWQTPISGHQTIKVYDVLGNEVATLVDEVKPAGYHSIEFDGSRLSSGVYFYKLFVEKYTQVKKMILIR